MKKMLFVFLLFVGFSSNLLCEFFYETSTNKNEDIEMFGLDPSLDSDIKKYDKYSKNIENLKDELKKEADILVFEIGGGRGRAHQQVPKFITELSKRFKDKKIKILGVDPNYLDEESLSEPLTKGIDFKQESLDKFGVRKYKCDCNVLEVILFPTLIPYNKEHSFYNVLSEVLGKNFKDKKVFIINSFVGDLDNIPYVMEKVKKAKKKDKNLLLFSQTGSEPWILVGKKGKRRKFSNIDGPNLNISLTEDGFKFNGVSKRFEKKVKESAVGEKVTIGGGQIEEISE